MLDTTLPAQAAAKSCAAVLGYPGRGTSVTPNGVLALVAAGWIGPIDAGTQPA